jgi:Dolichyl-phosphate-mannose-protein mannosyltransferase
VPVGTDGPLSTSSQSAFDLPSATQEVAPPWQRAPSGHALIVAGVIVAAAFLRLRYVAYAALWRDESLVYFLGLYPLGRLWSPELGLTGIHPPLFYSIHHFWTLLLGGAEAAHSTFAVRLPSVVFGTATVYLAYLVCKDLANRETGLIGAILTAVWRDHVVASQEGKAQVLVIFLMLALVWSTARLADLLAHDTRGTPLLRRTAFWIVCTSYVLSGVGITYTHSTGPVGIILANAMFVASLAFLDRRIRACGIWTAINILVVVAYFPWVRIIVSIVKNRTGYYSLALVDLSSPGGLLFQISGQSLQYRPVPGAILLATASTAAVVLATAACIWLGMMRRDPVRSALGAVVVCCPILLYMMSVLSTPIFIKHIVASFWLPLLVPVLALAIHEMRSLPLRWGAVAALIALSLLSLRGLPLPKEPWDKVAECISRGGLGSELVLYWPAYAQWGTDFYLPVSSVKAAEYALELEIQREFRPFSEVPVVDRSGAVRLLESSRHAFIVVDRKEMNSPIAAKAIGEILSDLRPKREYHTHVFRMDLEVIEILPPFAADLEVWPDRMSITPRGAC